MIRRAPAAEKCIAKIRKDDLRVRVLGTVIEKQEDILVIDDGTGQLTAYFTDPNLIKDLKQGDIAIVVGRPLEKGYLDGEIAIKAKINIYLYNKVKKIIEEMGGIL